MKLFQGNEHINFKYAKGNTDIYGKTFHTCYEIYILLNGKVEFINNHTRQIITPYQLIIVPPGEYHQIIPLDDIDSYERCVINMDSQFLSYDILKKAFADKRILTLTEEHRITQDFHYLIECFSTFSEDDFSHVMQAISTDIVFLIKNISTTDKLQSGSLRPIALELINYIDEHYTQPLDLKILSEKMHISVSSICHIFKESFGISIKKYILQKRMTASKIALQQGQRPEDVCYTYGFSNYCTFYRAYKNHFGISPSRTK